MSHLIAFYKHNIGIEQTYNKISNTLACMSNKQLEQMLADGKAMHKGIGGTSLQIEVDNTAKFQQQHNFLV